MNQWFVVVIKKQVCRLQTILCYISITFKINYQTMEPQQAIAKKTLQIFNGLQLEITFTKDAINFAYTNTNDNYQTFRAAVTSQTYSQLFPQISFFCDFNSFSNNVKEGAIKIKPITDTKFTFELDNPMNKAMPIKLPFLFKMDVETEVELLSKQLKACKAELEAFKVQKQHEILKYQEEIKNFEKTKDKQIKELYAEQKLKLQRIYFDNCKFRPIINSKLLKQTNFLDKFSVIALPIQYRLQLENFKRFLLHWPKYILSVIGEAMTGKSTLLTQLQEIDEPVFSQSQTDEKKQAKLQLFPVSDNPSTYYDTFYCYNTDSQKLLIAKDVNTRDLLFLEQFKEECTEMTLLCEDKLTFKQFQEISLAKTHENARNELALIQNPKARLQMLENRYQVLTFNKNIFADKYDKYIYLNKYIALLDRAGIDDHIFDQTQGMQKKELQKIKNCTVFYCIPAAQLMTTNTSIENNLLFMMNNNQFQKIILCINCNKTRFKLDIGMTDQIYNAKFADFLVEMIETIPFFIRKVIQKQIEILKKEEEKISSKIQKRAIVNSDEQKNQMAELYNQIKSKRLQRNKFQDQLSKYTNICKMLKEFAQKIKNLDIKTYGVTEKAYKILQQLIYKYPFKNVYFYGLENFEPKFPILKELKKVSKHQFYKKIGSQTLESIQKFYFNKIQSLNDFHNQLQKYYVNLPVVIDYFRQLGQKTEKNYLFDLRNQLIKIFTEQQKIFRNILTSIINQKNKLLPKKDQSFSLFSSEKKKNWQEQLKETIPKIFKTGTNRLINLYNQYRTLVYNYGSSLKKRLQDRVTKDLYNFVNSIKSSLELIIKQINDLTQSCIKPLINYWNLFVKTANADLRLFLPEKGLKQLEIPEYVALQGSNYYRIKIKSQSQNEGFFSSFFSSKEKKKSESKQKSEIKEKPEDYLVIVNKKFAQFTKDSQKIEDQMSKEITQNTKLLNNYQYMIINLMNSATIDEIDKERKAIEDAVLELKQEYLQKLRVINYDAVLNCVNKYEQREEERKKGWINEPEEIKL